MSCLFDSLSKFTNISSEALRNLLCDYLQNNGPVIENLDTNVLLALDTSPEVYIQKMRNPHEWGSAIEISAMCNMIGAKIIVIILRTGKQVEFLPIDGNIRYIFTISWSGNHFEPISSRIL